MQFPILDLLPGYDGFLIGSLEPLLLLSHVAVALVLGILISAQGGRSYWVLPTFFLIGVTAGIIAFLARNQSVVQYARDVAAWGIVALCIMALIARPIPVFVTAAVVAITGWGHGYVLADAIPPLGIHSLFGVFYTLGVSLTFIALIGVGLVTAIVVKNQKHAQWVMSAATVLLLFVGVYYIVDAVSCRSTIICVDMHLRPMFRAYFLQ